MSRSPLVVAALVASALLMPGPASASTFSAVLGEAPVQSASVAIPASEASDLFDRLGEAAENGDVEAMNLLGVLFVTNAKVASDYSMALYWFQRAVDAGSADGMYNLATLYLRGLGVTRDYVNAFRWFQRSADGGNAHAMFSVAAMAEYGLGATRDGALARRMYRKAAESGIPLAMLWLSDDLARSSSGSNLVEAHAWLEVAALAEMDGQLHLVLLARMQDLANRLDPAERDRAHVRAAQIVADMRARAPRTPSNSPLTAPSKRGFPSA